MKRIFAIILAVVMLLCVVFTLSGCNKQIFDTTYNFKTAIISLPNGEIIEGKVDSWKDFEDGDQIQVKINGVTYLVHSSDICLMTE
jgi:hypothetical protein